MGESAVEQQTSKPLEDLLGSVASEAVKALQPLVGKDVTAKPGRIGFTDTDKLLANLAGEHAVVCARLDKDYAGQILRFVLPSPDAVVLAGCAGKADDAAIEERRNAGTLGDEDLEAFAQVAGALCSSVQGLVCGHVEGELALELGDQGVVTPGTDADGRLGQTDHVSFSFPFEVQGHPESELTILLEPETAERWNGGALPAAASAEMGGAGALPPEDDLEDIPEAEICGKLAAYLLDTTYLLSIRKSCRRMGLELSRHASSEIPNPAVHRDEVVILEVPPADTKRFEWCRRLKDFPGNCKVILLLRRPTRSQVVRGFVAQADVIMGLPFTEPQLSAKLNEILAEAEPAQ